MSAASVEGRVALGPTSGQPLTRRGRQRDRRPLFLPGELCCDLAGFSLHAKVAIEGHDRAGLERLCRYIARPAIASERLSIDPDGRVVYRLRRAWRDGTNAIVFEPLAFLERLAALVPRPRAHLLTYHGVLAPAAQLECPGSSRSDESRRRISVVAKGIPTASRPGRAHRPSRTTVRRSATPAARTLPTSSPRSRTQPEPAGSVGPISQRPSFRRGRSHVSRLRRCAQADRHDHRRARRAQDPRATSSCPAQPRRSLPPERRQSPSSPGSPGRERSAHLQRGAVWRRRAPGRKPSHSGRLEAAPEPARSTETGLRGTGSTRPGSRDLPGIGPNRYPLPGVIRLEFLAPAPERARSSRGCDATYSDWSSITMTLGLVTNVCAVIGSTKAACACTSRASTPGASVGTGN